MENKRKFAVELDGKTVEFSVVRPTAEVEQEGDRVYARVAQEAVLPSDGRPAAFHRESLDRVARKRGLWDDARQARDEELLERLRTGAKALATGGIRVSAARVVATAMHADRQELRALREGRDRLLETTVEGRAEQSRFNHFVAACTVREDTGERYFESVEQMLGDDDPVVYPAGRELAALLYGHDADFDLKLPEAAFLVARGFATPENGRLRLHDRTDGPARIAG